jgi:hypothetical protein
MSSAVAGGQRSRAAIANGVAMTIVALVVSSISVPAVACPRCAAGQEARREVLEADFTRQLAVTALPFMIVGAISSVIHGVGRRRPRRQRHSSSGGSQP